MHYTYAEYIALEEFSDVRHEYLDGEIYALAGGTLEHGVLASAAQAIIRPQLPDGCRTFTSDVRVRIVSTGLSTYPDGGVICGEAAHATDDLLAITNPIVLIEVTSNSSDEYDRGDKLRHYQTIPSVMEVMIISHRQPRVSVHRHTEHRWMSVEAGKGQSVTLESINAVVDVDDLYRDVIAGITRS